MNASEVGAGPFWVKRDTLTVVRPLLVHPVERTFFEATP
jgi:hypothetical protein